jgi:YHS domain-containing protein
MQFHIFPFEGPDAYSRAGGIATRVEGLARALADLRLETHLWFVGDPDLPGHEEQGGPPPPPLGAVGQSPPPGRGLRRRGGEAARVCGVASPVSPARGPRSLSPGGWSRRDPRRGVAHRGRGAPPGRTARCRPIARPDTSVTKDPICGMTVDEATALHAERDGKMFYFCSDHCRQQFLSRPEGAKPEGKSGCCRG